MSIHISSAAWKVSGITSMQKLVLVKLSDNANDAGDCWPSVGTVARECCCSTRAVQSAITTLSNAGHLTRRLRTGDSTLYRIHPRTTCTPANPAPPHDVHPPPAPAAPPLRTTCTPPTHHVHPNRKEPSENPQGTVRGGKRFSRPTPEQVTAYAKTIGFDLDGNRFCDHYEAKGWLLGKSPMKSWQAAVRTWKSNQAEAAKPKQKSIIGIPL
jgi:hypothetical protein